MKLRLEHFILIASVVAIVLGLLLFGGRAPRQPDELERQRAGQSSAFSRHGTSAFYSVLGKLGAKVERWEKRFDLLTDDVNVLIVVAPPAEPDGDETKFVLGWVARGGTLIYFPSGTTTSFAAGLGWRVEARERGASTLTAKLGRELYELRLGTDSRVHPAPGARPAPVALAEDELGWLISESTLGRGRMIVVSDPAVVSNAMIGEAENAAAIVRGLVLPAASGGRVVFDEYHHGFAGAQDLLGYVMSTPAAYVAWHAVIAGFLLILLTRRLGPPREMHEERRRRPQEFIEAFARLCRARGSRGLALSLVVADARESFRKKFGSTERAVIVREAGRRGRDGAKLADALETGAKAAGKNISAGMLIQLTATLDELRALGR